MSRPFRFAVQGGPFDDPDALGLHARQVESLGYDELYSSDHVDEKCLDPFVALVVAAVATTRLRVGPLVLNNEFHHPVLLARTAISVDVVTSGRLVLGLGTGYAQAEHDAIGLQLLAPGDRVTRFGESLAVLRDLIDTGSCTFQGQYHSVAVDRLATRPDPPRVPFLIGGHGRRVVRLAAEFADIYQFTGLTHGAGGAPSGGGFPLEQLELRSRWLGEDAGARDHEIERSALVQFSSVGPTAPGYAEMEPRFNHSADVLDGSPFVLSGSLDQVVDKLERLREQLGISHYVVRDPEGFAPVVESLRGH